MLYADHGSPKYFYDTIRPEARDQWEVRRDRDLVVLSHPTVPDDPLVLHPAWLRDACTCGQCVDPSSGQKRFATTDIPDRPRVLDAKKTSEGLLEVHWADDFLTSGTHISEYPASFTSDLFGHPDPSSALPAFKIWDRQDLEKLDPFFDYQDFVGDGTNRSPQYYAAMTALHTHGLFFLKNVPPSDVSVESIATRIGIIQETFYGRLWEVVSKPDAENVAYTSSFLGLHQDLLYMTCPPRIQLLHCLENTCDGGESIFTDGRRVKAQIYSRFEDNEIRRLHHPVRYRYEKGGHSYTHRHPILAVSKGHGVCWSPPFQHPEQFQVKTESGQRKYQAWIRTVRRFKALLEAEEYSYVYKMKPGECVIFDNLRLLHGRRQFDTSSGQRRLMGTYIDEGSYLSTLQSMKEQLTHHEGLSLDYQAEKLFTRHPGTAPKD
ncbi:Clavaminate synthase-like protein [Whalleya microplaca]|nr:Clavaminate synthase-like protein [Whalleya microplaca]